MEFRIERTSDTRHRPCEGAYRRAEWDDLEWSRWGWAIEIASLDELLALVRKHGRIIIAPPPKAGGPFHLEIYDYYRE